MALLPAPSLRIFLISFHFSEKRSFEYSRVQIRFCYGGDCEHCSIVGCGDDGLIDRQIDTDRETDRFDVDRYIDTCR
jgi:hypothetical protein